MTELITLDNALTTTLIVTRTDADGLRLKPRLILGASTKRTIATGGG